MTEEEKKRLLAGFVKPEPEPEEEQEDPRREEKLLETAHRIAKRLGLTEPFADRAP